MAALLLVVLCVALHCGSCNTNIYYLMDNVLVLKVPHDLSTIFHVPLFCGEQYKDDRSIFWKRKGLELNPALIGNNVSAVVEEMVAGNYSCHGGQDGRYLNHTLVLVQLNPDNKTTILQDLNQYNREEPNGPNPSPPKHILCSGYNYNGSFHCTWNSSRSEAKVLLVEAERNSSAISCSLDAGGSGLWCHEKRCWDQEEQHRVVIKVYVKSYTLLEMYATQFYLREIVRPENAVNLREVENNVFAWNVPDSWEKPCKYYALHYEVKLVRHGDCDGHPLNNKPTETTIETRYTVKVKPKKYVFCVRGQDKFTSGPWSEWTKLAKKAHRS